MNSRKRIKVNTHSNGQRLDVFLASELDASRSQIQKLIKENLVMVDGELPKKSGDKISNGDKIEIHVASAKKEEGRRRKGNAKKLKLPKIKIIEEAADYLVVEKPVGLLTHPTMKNEHDSLSSILTAQYPELKKIGDDPARPGIVHRLDKDASGLLVIARTQKMFNHLKEQFKKRTINKEYLALAHGKVAKDWDEIKFPIARGKNSERMAALPFTSRGEKTIEGKEALTEFLVEKRFVNFTLLKVKIHTGRMHQIRVHLLAYNHPLVGDPLYFQKKRKDKWDKKLGRLFLHCTKLSFKDLNGETQTFQSPLPKNLAEFLTHLK